MSTSIAATSSTSTQQSQWLAQALQAGNQTGSSTQTTSSTQTAGSTQTGSSRQSALAALGQDLQSGNLAGAQQAFAQLQQAGGTSGTSGTHRHHHHHGGQGGQGAGAASAPAGDTLNISGNTGTVNAIVGASGSTPASSGTGSAAPETINITGNTGTINIIA